MSATREVSILRDGSEFRRQFLELLRLPDGAEGAKWGGLVFPLREGNRIDLGDRGLPPRDCTAWAEPARGWAVATGSEGEDVYLFLEGSAHTCGHAVRKLQEAGLTLVRSGPNLS